MVDMDAIWRIILIIGTLDKVQGSGVHSYLFTPEYNNRVRPSANNDQPINVTFGLSLHEIIDMNDINQRLDLRITIREYWTDPSLSWNKTQFGGTEYIAVNPDTIWIPDIVLYNNAGEGFGEGVTRTQAVIRYDGCVQMNIPSILKSTCKVHLENYPFDEQDCKIKFGSWTYDSSQLGLHLESSSADLSSFLPNVEWKLKEMPAEFHSVKYLCCVHPYEDIEYVVKIKRRSLFHAMYLIIPCAVISLLTLLVFLLPPECNERMTVGMAILVGLSFFFLLVAEKMPPTSESIPVIGLYYSITMLEVSSAFFMTCFVLVCHHYNPEHGELPDWSRKHLERLGRFLRFPFNFTRIPKSTQMAAENMAMSTQSLNDAINGSVAQHKTADLQMTKQPPTTNDANRILQDHISYKETMEKRQEEWRMAALVLNSIFMWIYIFSVVFTLAILLVPRIISAL